MGRPKGWHHTEETKRKMSKTQLLRDYSYISAWNKGLTKEIDERVFRLAQAKIGEKNPMFGRHNYNWQGLTPFNLYVKGCAKYITLRNEIYKRDKYSCQICKDNKGGNLNVHHKYRFSFIVNDFLKINSQYSPIEDLEILIKLSYKYEPFWNMDNCITLCEKCHKKLHTKKELNYEHTHS